MTGVDDLGVRIRLSSPLGSPLVSGSIFGHYCWTLRQLRGEDWLEAFLAGLESAPVVFSDAFPAGCVPVPLLPPYRPAEEGTLDTSNAKILARRQFVTLDSFLRFRGVLDPRRVADLATGASVLQTQRTAHNRIDRLTGTTPPSGGLYFVEEDWPGASGAELDIYIRAAEAAESISEVFTLMGRQGFGRDASIGRGQFEVIQIAPAPELKGAGNRWVSWSRGCLSEAIREPRYRLYTHYGKLGGLWATTEKPFKYPLTLWRAGATFAAAEAAAPFGRLLHGLHREKSSIVHNAWHFAVPYSEAA